MKEELKKNRRGVKYQKGLQSAGSGKAPWKRQARNHTQDCQKKAGELASRFRCAAGKKKIRPGDISRMPEGVTRGGWKARRVRAGGRKSRWCLLFRPP